MAIDNFSEGYLEYETATLPAITEDWTAWQDGFLACSNQEVRFDPQSHPSLLEDLLSEAGKTKRLPSGYLMEVNLWATGPDGELRELVIERRPDGFFRQSWRLRRQVPAGESANCYWCEVETHPMRRSTPPPLFTRMKSVEVICHDHRLNFFLTTGGKTS